MAGQNRRRKARENGQRHGKTTSENDDVSFLFLTFPIFFNFLVLPDFHFSTKIFDSRRYVRYSPIRTGILSGMNQGCFCTDSPTNMINSGHTSWYDMKLTPLLWKHQHYLTWRVL